MQIGIHITAYNRFTAGPGRDYVLHLNTLACVTGKEDNFAHGYQHARSMIDGMKAVDPHSSYEIAKIEVGAPGAGITIDGESIYDVQRQFEETHNAKKA